MIVENCSSYVFDELENLFTIEVWKNKFIVLWGMNTPAKIEIMFFQKYGIPVAAIVDNDVEKQGRIYQEIPVCPPKEILTQRHQDTIIIVASSAYDAICREAKALGYQEGTEIYRLKTFDYQGIPELFHKNIVKCTHREVQMEELRILIYIRDLCQKHHLRYFLGYGTLLGAVRHQGFIPWDDDIDILMPYPDYVQFCKLCSEEDVYELDSMLNISQSQLPLVDITRVRSKFMYSEYRVFPLRTKVGVHVDIYPMSGCPDTLEKRKTYHAAMGKYDEAWNEKIIIPMCTPQYSQEEHKKIFKDFIQFSTKYDYDSSAFVGVISMHPGIHCTAPKELYDNTVTMNFEGEEFCVASGWDETLKKCYGNYMELPPVQERKPHFNSVYCKTGKI